MNGPLASEDPDDPKVTDYSLGEKIIYAAFAWSEAKAAYARMFELAGRHGVGFFDVSTPNGNIWFPGKDGDLQQLPNASAPKRSSGTSFWTTRMLGKVDRVSPSLFVATKFRVIFILPVYPMATYIVRGEARRGSRAIYRVNQIPLSLKSCAMAWSRVILTPLFTVLAIASVALVSESLSGKSNVAPRAVAELLIPTIIVGLCLILPYWIPGLGRATASRGAQLQKALSEEARAKSSRIGTE
jgi:hypothetical protein